MNAAAFIGAAAILAVGLGTAQAAPITYAATLSGAAENPAVPTLGTGNVIVTIDTTAHTLSVNVTFSGLTGNTTAAHIHCCATPTTNAGVVTQTPSFIGFPLGVTSGSADLSFDTTLASTWNPTFLTNNALTPLGAEAFLASGLAAGTAYFNVHTTFRSGGEVRGNLAAVPEPASLGLLAAGVVGLAVARRRRQHTAA